MMNRNELDQYLEIIKRVLLNSAVKINEWRESFMHEMLLLYLIIPGRINFLQLGCYGRWMNSVTVSSSNVSVTGCLLMPAWLIHIPTIWLLSLLIRAISANRVNARPIWGVSGPVVLNRLNMVWKFRHWIHWCRSSQLLSSRSCSNTTGKNTGASQVDTNRLVFACVTKPQGNTSTVDQPCGGQCLFLQIIFCGWRPGYGIICNQSFSRWRLFSLSDQG